MAQANIQAVITAEDRASAVLRGFDSRLNRIGHSVGRVLRRAFIVGSAAVAGFTAFVWKSVKAFGEEEAVIARLKAGIKNVTSARNHNVKALLKQASALQAVTRFADEEVISAQGVLTTFQLNQDAIKKLTPRLLDMSEGIARVSGGLPDLEGNAILVAKALGGNDIQGLAGALRRVGVIMTSTQQEVLKTGTMQERLAIITKILDQNYKGLAKEIGATTLGRMAQLKHALGDLQEVFGGVIAKALTPFIVKLTNWARSDEARKTIKEIATKVAEMAKAFINFIINNWPKIRDAFISLIDKLRSMAKWIADNWGLVKNLAKVLLGLIIISKITRFVNNLALAFSLLNLNPAILAIGAVALAFWGVYKAIKWTLRLIDRYNDTQIVQKPGISGGGGGASGGRSFQLGGPVSAGVPITVGERGREMFVPKEPGRIIPNHQLQGGPVTFNVNIGMFAGTKMERRQIAKVLFKDFQDVAKQFGLSPTALLDSTNGARIR